MKISFLVDSFPKVSETFVLNQLTWMLDQGHEVEIFARQESNESNVHEEVESYDLLNKTHYANPPENKVLRLCHATKMIATQGYKYPKRIAESLRFDRYGRDAYSLRMLHYSLSYDVGDTDVLLCHFGPNGNLGSLLTRTDVDAQIVTMFHGYDVKMDPSMAKKYYEPLFQECNVLLANSTDTMERLIEFGADEDQVYYHPVGIDPDRFDSSRNHFESNDLLVVTTVARLVEEKDIDCGIRGVAKLVKNNPDMDLIYRIVGGGEKERALKKLTHELGIEDVVEFMGQVNRHHVEKILKNSDVFLLTSVREGFGVVLLEAQAAGIPVIATEVGGIPEAVNGGKSAILVPPRDPDTVADRLTYLFKHPEQRESMGEAGKRYVRKNFDIQQLNRRLEELLQSLIAE
jgi:colanic acid/amylovoran biosynthesis glycosyltransferase